MVSLENRRASTYRWNAQGCAGLCLWVGLSAGLMVAPAWADEERTVAPGGIVSGVPSGENEFTKAELSGLGNTPEMGTLPEGTVPGGTWPNVTPSGGTVPGGTWPNVTLPGGTLPGGTVPSENLPGEDP